MSSENYVWKRVLWGYFFLLCCEIRAYGRCTISPSAYKQTVFVLSIMRVSLLESCSLSLSSYFLPRIGCILLKVGNAERRCQCKRVRRWQEMSSFGFVTTARVAKFGWHCWPAPASDGPQFESCQVTRSEILVNYLYLILSLLSYLCPKLHNLALSKRKGRSAAIQWGSCFKFFNKTKPSQEKIKRWEKEPIT